ncbi:hypothetical protein BDY19DRAFT_1087795 [Irpex rosettiformis]|uniref:Uncharacterized protein n=1 Tax=Irpex rosettiformis TaxID=378272 RepID=A0ACB8U7S9_9APHY|nr:hypothetical protein BDY19DRAFT_1087795 [Irpex rosettiformis]
MQESVEVWYADGSLVLRAGDTLFSVYSGIMAQRSTIFHDMFNTAQPNPTETYNGRPVVEVFDDPEVLTYLLKSMHDHEYLELQVLPKISRMLYVFELATKYHVVYLRSIILHRLLERFCATTHAQFVDETRSSASLNNWILIANVARRCDAPILLPYALFQCGRKLKPSNLVLNDASREKLSQLDRALIADGTVKLFQALRRTAYQPVYFPSSDDFVTCSSVVNCRTGFSRMAQDLEDEIPQSLTARKVVWKSVRASYPNICASCIARWRVSFGNGWLEVWDKLPSYFDLPTWEELKQQSEL